MTTKLQLYATLAERALGDLTDKRGNWTNFLNSAAWLYKYPFHDQLMIYMQRPDATACAELEFWNEKFNRWVRRGAKGIALIDESGSYPQLKYVFDVSDTEPSLYRARPVQLWELRQEHKANILADLEKNYEDVSADDTLADAFHNIAKQLVREYYEDNYREILSCTENSILEPPVHYDFAGTLIEEADDSALRAVFEKALTDSVTYTVMIRCGFDPNEYFTEDDFQGVLDFNTPDMANTLGVATGNLSEQILRDIEIIIRKYERNLKNNILESTHENAERSEQDHGNTNVHNGRGLSPAQPDTERTAEGIGGAARQVRTEEESVPQRTQADNIQPPVINGEAVPAPAGSGRSSDSEARAGDGRIDGAEHAAGQSDRPDSVDSGNELNESASRGNGLERTDLQLDERPEAQTQGAAEQQAAPLVLDDEAQFEQEQPSQSGAIPVNEVITQSFSQLGKSSIEQILKNSAISLAEVDSILRDGGNFDNHFLTDMPFQSRSSLRIAAYFVKDLSDNADFLKREYLTGKHLRNYTESGKGFDFGNHRVCAWFTNDGIELAIGSTAKNNINKTVIQWEDAAARVGELMRAGQYISASALENALENERLELASELWFFYRDDMGGLPEEWKADHGGHPDDVAIIKSLLDDVNERQTIRDRLEADVMALTDDPGEPHTWHNPLRLLDEMNIAMHPPVIAPDSDYTYTRDFSYFITQDEIEALLTRGSTSHEGKLRIVSFFLGDNDDNAKLDFIKREYGHGGGTWGLTDGWQDAEPGKGLSIQRGKLGNPDAEVNLKWNTVIKRIEQLISEGSYLTRAELDFIPRYERLILVRQVSNFYYNLPDEYERPFQIRTWQNYSNTSREDIEQLLDFTYPCEAEWQAIRDFLDNPERVEAVLAQMRHIFENTSTEDRYYSSRKSGYEALTSFRDGTYTLFPGIENLPDPETASTRTVKPKPKSEIIEDMREPRFSRFDPGELQEMVQPSFFDTNVFPVLPSVDEQRERIDHTLQQEAQQEVKQETHEAGTQTPALSLPIDTDAVLLNISDEDKTRIVEQFTGNPRSREAVNLIREVYGGTLSIPASQAVKRIIELVADGAFKTSSPTILPEHLRGELPESGFTEPGEPVERSIGDNSSINSEPPTMRIAYNIGDRIAYNGKPYEIEQIDYYVKVHNLGTPSTYPVFDNISFLKTDFEHMLSAGVITIEPRRSADKDISENPLYVNSEDLVSELPIETLPDQPDKPATFDFDSIAQTALERVIADSDYTKALTNAASRASLRNPCTWVLEQTICNHKQDEPEVFRLYFSDDDFNDRLFDYVLKQSWQHREQMVVETEHEAEPQPKDKSPARIPEIADSVQIAENEKAYIDGESHDDGRPPYDGKPQATIGHTKPKDTPIAKPALNYRITDDHLGEGGAKTKFRNNVNALQTLKNIESENRSATPEEQEILSRYVGWGGIPQTFDPDNKGWEAEYIELNALLTPEEWDSARASTLNAHYTSPIVIKAMYDVVERLNFKSGNILEPSCGVGNFLGLLPDTINASKLYGVELDSVTARIAKQLYPKADIREMGYEKTDFPDSFFDLAIGNVPFGAYGVIDKRYEKQNFNLHNYFFAKSIDKVRPGGIVAFITSKYTMDEKSPKVRKYIAERAELLGAVRLPNNAFLKNAGTETTMDILFLQKRTRPYDVEPEWVHLGMTEDGIPVNRYYLDNPEMLLGKMALDERMNSKYGRDNVTACLPIEGADLAEQLKAALINIQGEYTVEELDDLDGVDNHAIPADPYVKNFSYTEIDGTVYFRENSLMYPVDLPAMTLMRIKGMIELRECVQKLIALQLDEYDDADIKAQQAVLNTVYDKFAAEFGLISSPANNRAFNADSAYYLLSSLEVLNEDGELDRKADMFSKRTIKQKTVITHVDTASEALAVSIGEKTRVDLEYMSELTGFSREKLLDDLCGVVYLNIGSANTQEKTYVTADEYLSGNVREKLHLAEAAAKVDPSLNVNVEALKAIQPKNLEASEIAVRLGTTWINPEYIQQFMHELLDTSYYSKKVYQVKYHAITGEWQVTGKGKAQFSDINATVTYGTSRMNAYQIIDDTLNLKDARVYDYIEDPDGKQRRELNKKETMLAQQKQEIIKQKFKDWIWADPERRQSLVRYYNEQFNSIRPREYDGSHITFGGINPGEKLQNHQADAIARIIYGGNTLLAHVVGAGKTWEVVAAAMESKRLGLCQKNMIAVPNHLTEQWAGEWLRLYPSANILVATKKDFEMRNRKKFCAKIATGDYDAVIIGHSQLEKIPMSKERQERQLREQMYDIEEGILELKASNGERYSIKQLEKTKRNLEIKLEKLLDGKTRDDVVTFEQLGVDRLFVDEAHSFKNLYLYTKMRNVAGLSTSEAQKSSDLFMKCRYLDELTGNKGVIFATGTPISNSMSEMYTMQRYLQYDMLSQKNLTHFDAWASTFGETVTSIELAPEGTGYRARTRFARFHNLPELLSLFKQVADIKTADMLNLPVPEAKYENIVVEPSELQKEMVAELSERAAAVHSRMVDPNVDNMLKTTTDGRKIGLDQRLINPLLPDYEGSKVNACTDNVYEIWNDTKADRLTPLVFCDFSTPNKDGRFNVYDDMRAKLIERGIPEHEIAFIHDADTEIRKKELFAKVRQGKVRVLFGSTVKMGTGTNVQDRLIAVHDADCPWRPADLEQRAGRIIRHGNNNPKVQIFRYATIGTFDSYLWQTVQKKQEFIAQIMSSKSPVRSCEDVDETALSYAEIKALCAGNPLIAEKMNLDNEVSKLRMLKAEHRSQHFRLEDDLLKRFPEMTASVTERISGIEKDIAHYTDQKDKYVEVKTVAGSASVTSKFPGMTVNGVVHIEKEPAAKALIESCKGIQNRFTDLDIGEYMGFKMSLRYVEFGRQINLMLRGAITYQVELGIDALGNITRINNALDKLPEHLDNAKIQLENNNRQIEAAKLELAKPFEQEQELQEKEARLALLNADLNIDGDGGFDILNDPENRESGDNTEQTNDYSNEIQTKNSGACDSNEEGLDSDDSGYEQRSGYNNATPQTASEKPKPSVLDGIRNFVSSTYNSGQNRETPNNLQI